jgi:DnaK suppressor protein
MSPTGGSMNKEQVKEFERKLLEKRRGIAGNSSRVSGLGADSEPEYGRDEGDRANASQAKEMNWLRTSQERGLLELVDGALSRIREGSFGECLHCGQEIGAKRLAAIPWTRYCITCQELLEEHGR